MLLRVSCSGEVSVKSGGSREEFCVVREVL